MDKPSLADLFGKEDDASDEAEDGADSKSDLPEDFKTAYEEWENEPSAETFWRAVEACVDNSGSDKKSGTGLMLLLGKAKKKPRY